MLLSKIYFISIILTIFFSVIGILLARWIISPVASLANLFREVHEEECFSTVIPFCGKQNEIGQLARAIEKFRDSARRSNEVLRWRHNQLIQTSEELNSERRRLARVNAELVVAKEKAEKAAKTESQFLSNMSHELRTPMHAILGYSEICLQDIDGDNSKNIRKYLTNIEASGKRLLNLLNDLLDVAKLEAGRTEYRREPGDLRDVVHHTLMELDPLIKGKNMQVCLRIGEHTKAVFDKQHMIQVLVNLVSNAVKFSEFGKPDRDRDFGDLPGRCHA